MDAEVIGHMKSYSDDYPDDGSLSVEVFAMKLEGTVCYDSTSNHMYGCGEESSCDVHPSHSLSLCTHVMDKIGYMFDKTKS